MPVYELILVIQKLERLALKGALKRSAGYIFEQDGIIRNIENLGFRQLPYYISAKGKKHHFGNFFIFNYDVGSKKPKLVLEKLKLDLDIVRATNYLRAESPLELHAEKAKPECTLYLDLLPPPSRPPVVELQELAKRKLKKRKYSGVNFEDTDFLVC